MIPEYISVVPEEHEVPLVMEGYDSAPREMRVPWKHSGQLSAQSISQLAVEVLEDQLGVMCSIKNGTTIEILTQLQA